MSHNERPIFGLFVSIAIGMSFVAAIYVGAWYLVHG